MELQVKYLDDEIDTITAAEYHVEGVASRL